MRGGDCMERGLLGSSGCCPLPGLVLLLLLYCPALSGSDLQSLSLGSSAVSHLTAKGFYSCPPPLVASALPHHPSLSLAL